MTKKTKSEDKVAATVTIYRASDMTKKGRKSIAAWIRRQARYLECLGGLRRDYAKTYRARCLYK
jgi:hypothetical protein